MQLLLPMSMHVVPATYFEGDRIVCLNLWSDYTPTLDLDQQLVRVTLDVPLADLKPLPDEWDHAKPKRDLLPGPGVYGWGRGTWTITTDKGKPKMKSGQHDPKTFDRFIYFGPANGLKAPTVLSTAQIETDRMIPRSVVVFALSEAAATSVRWWEHPSLLQSIDTLQPKWGAKGYPVKRFGDNVQVDYVPVTVNLNNLRTVLSTLSGLGASIEGLVTAHGADIELPGLFE